MNIMQKMNNESSYNSTTDTSVGAGTGHLLNLSAHNIKNQNDSSVLAGLNKIN